ncbi:hypothetical protein FDP41_000924 [Naegleria fowleri]|uniref:Glycosyltransferase 61 catalytic domain-containing protein n=1 Tax=Naegleria fowleri TaxID=5763 RepID=A0A6A5BZ09_NAEFO|nr:uncharacterized protein FDP41_000924 [Naegleria fowleri]KAF0979771.1 hypothetical protein FDP41_000924 [Naegleria fowleri]
MLSQPAHDDSSRSVESSRSYYLFITDDSSSPPSTSTTTTTHSMNTRSISCPLFTNNTFPENHFRNLWSDWQRVLKEFDGRGTHEKAWIFQIDCAWIDENSFHSDISWATFTDDGIIVHSQLERRMVPTISSSFRVRNFDVIGNPGYSVYPYANGHMPVEILPRLVRMWNELPPEIPLIWPRNVVSERYLKIMLELRVISGNRTLVDSVIGTVIRAKKVFIYHSDTDFYPNMNIMEYLVLNRKIVAGMARMFGEVSLTRTSKIITLIHRNARIRNVKDHPLLLEHLRQSFPQHVLRKFIIPDTNPSEYLKQVARLFYESDIVISPHGASLSNIIFSRPGSGIIEIGWGSLPMDYMCFARNMKLKYTLVCADGHHQSDLVAPFNDVSAAVRLILSELYK